MSELRLKKYLSTSRNGNFVNNLNNTLLLLFMEEVGPDGLIVLALVNP